jgi:hypothetical protein
MVEKHTRDWLALKMVIIAQTGAIADEKTGLSSNKE